MDVAHHSMGFDVQYRIMTVDRATGYETGQLQGVVDGGTIERNQDTSVTEQATVDYVGDIAGLERILLRIYADLTYDDGSVESIALGTFVPDASKINITGSGSNTAPLTLYGRLRELQDDMFAQPVSVTAGSNPVDVVEGWCKQAGLRVAHHEECVYRLGSVWTVGNSNDTSSSKLTIINKLLTLAGWQSARTNEYGEIVLQPYTRPQDKTPAWSFTEGVGARFLRSMTDEIDWFSVANMVSVTYTTADREIIGLALDDDPKSPFSSVSRGRIIARHESYNDIPSNLNGLSLQEYADSKARELLTTEQSVIRRITFTHVYAPVSIGDVVNITYPSGNVTGNYAIRTQKIHLTGGLPIDCEARAYVRSITHD